MSDEAPKPKKKLVLETSANVKINTGNFETIDISKSIRVEIEYDNADEILKKSKAVDALVAKAVKAEGELLLKETGRVRVVKANAAEKEADIWNGPPATPAMTE